MCAKGKPKRLFFSSFSYSFHLRVIRRLLHGGFAHDDTNVIMLQSNPKFRATTVTIPVTTMSRSSLQ
jgi:hypothetical protein